MRISDTGFEHLKFELAELLRGGFAPNVILLREFDYKKAGIILDGLHFSVWMLLGHIRWRHNIFMQFMERPDDERELWPPTFWPENHQPGSESEWNVEIDKYEAELEKMIRIVLNLETDLFAEYKGKTIFSSVLIILHHTGYHIGQLKTIGRQLGVW